MKLRIWPDPVNSPETRSKAFIFFLCLVFSFLAWIFIKLSRETSTLLPVEITISNVPDSLIFTHQTDSTFALSLQATGIRLFTKRTIRRTHSLEVDYNTLQKTRATNNYQFYYTAVQAELRYSLLNDIPIGNIDARPDTIFLTATKAFREKVPVIAKYEIDYRPGFRLYNFPVVTPDSVWVTGPESLKDSIDFIFTSTIKASNADKNILQSVNLLKPFANRNVTISQTNANVVIPVEEFTESSVELPLTLDCPGMEHEFANSRILLFPDKVTISYLVALKDIKSILPEMFTATVGCPDSNSVDNTRLPVEITEHPGLIEIIRARPDEVEYVWITNQ